MKEWAEPPWVYLYVLVVGGAVTALTTWILDGDGVDWALTGLLTAAMLVGTFIANQIKARR